MQTATFECPVRCSGCRKVGLFAAHFSQTAYHFEGKTNSKDDPNRAKFFCKTCKQRDIEYWDEMWRNFGHGM